MSKYIVVVSFEDYADNVSQVAFIAPSERNHRSHVSPNLPVACEENGV